MKWGYFCTISLILFIRIFVSLNRPDYRQLFDTGACVGNVCSMTIRFLGQSFYSIYAVSRSSLECRSNLENIIIIYWHKETTVRWSMFIAKIDSAIELFVVRSSFVRISPILYALFARLKALSTATLSALSMYSSFLSALWSFFGLPSDGPESLILCFLQYCRLIRLRYILSASIRSGYLPVRSLYLSAASTSTSLSLFASNDSFSILP